MKTLMFGLVFGLINKIYGVLYRAHAYSKVGYL